MAVTAEKDAECICPYTPHETWLSAASCGYGSGYEPGSMQEWNPDCPAHPPTDESDALVEYGVDAPMPYHLDLNHPALSTCPVCGRSTWSTSEVGKTCNMPQPLQRLRDRRLAERGQVFGRVGCHGLPPDA